MVALLAIAGCVAFAAGAGWSVSRRWAGSTVSAIGIGVLAAAVLLGFHFWPPTLAARVALVVLVLLYMSIPFSISGDIGRHDG